MKKRKIKFIVRVVKWFDKVNGNTYHSVRVTRVSDGKVIVGLNAPYEYGYGDQYCYTALEAMAEAKWLPVKYRDKHEDGFPKAEAYERENNYPIEWIVSHGLKREMVDNGTL